MNRSDSIIKIAGALVKFNSEIGKISKDANNPFFKNKYATLDTIIDEIRPVLTNNGLSILQLPSGDGEHAIIKTLLLHESGEWIESEPLIMKPVKNDPQAYGSCITYMRRYSLTSFLSLNTGEDDDANRATHGPNKPQQTDKTNRQNEVKPTKGEVSIEQVQRLYTIAKSKGITDAQVKSTMSKDFNKVSASDLTKVEYETICSRLEKAGSK